MRFIHTRLFILSLLLFLLIQSPILALTKEELDNKIGDLEEKIELNKKEKDAIKKDLKAVGTDIVSTNKEIEKIKTNISNTEKQIDSLATEIAQISKEIIQKEEEIKLKQEELDKQKDKLGHTFSFMYENRNVNFFDYLLNSENLNSLLNSFEFMNTIAAENESIYYGVKEEEEKLKVLKEELTEKKQDTENKKVKQEELKKELLIDDEKLNILMDTLKGQEAELEEELHKKEEDDKKAMELIAKHIQEKEKILRKEAEARRKAEEEKRKKEEEERKKEEEKRLEGQKGNQNSGNNGEQPVTEVTPPPTPETSSPSTTWVNPMKRGTYYISSGYGTRIDPVYGTQSFHNGIDFAAPSRTPIYAAGSGIVLFSGPASGYGNWVVIAHDNGYYTIYGHMARRDIFVSEGQYVNAGQHIAGVGTEGKSTGYHLHFAVANGFNGYTFRYVNPLTIFNP